MHLHRTTPARRALAATATAACAAFGALTLGAPAHAGRPLATEDAAVLERRACEVESFASRLTERGTGTAKGWSLQLGCGVGLGSQVALATTSSRADGVRTRGLALVGKTALHTHAEGAPAYTLAWALVAADEPGRSRYRLQETELKGVASLPLAEGLGLHANLAWARDQQTHQNSTRWALALEYAALRHLDLMAEAFASDRDKSPWVQVGLRWAALPERLYLDGSLGQQTTGLRPRQVTFGLKAPF